MTLQNNENLEELLEEFYEPEQARQVAQLIRKADELFRLNPPAQPDARLITEIKTKVIVALAHRKAANRMLTFARAAVAVAALLVLAWAGLKLTIPADKQLPRRQMPMANLSDQIWDNDEVGADDPELATLKAEISETARCLLTIQLDENAGENGLSAWDVEHKLIEMESDFWKG
jgi:hypothetical protein